MDCRSEWNGRCDLPHGLHVVIHIVQVDGTHECFIGRLRSSLALADQNGTAIIHVLAEMHAELASNPNPAARGKHSPSGT
jgi:hypothetical protein